MESKVIMQDGSADIELSVFNEETIAISHVDAYDCTYIDITSIPDLIAALQSFLPKETE